MEDSLLFDKICHSSELLFGLLRFSCSSRGRLLFSLKAIKKTPKNCPLVQTRFVSKQTKNSLFFCRRSRYLLIFFFVLDGYAGCKESVSRFCRASGKPPWKDVLVFHKSVDVVLGSVFTCGNLKDEGYTEQSLLGVAVCHHLWGQTEVGHNSKEGKSNKWRIHEESKG